MTAKGTKPLFSVLTTSFNHERYLVPMLESVAAQEFRDFEFIFVDDGSTDSTADIFARWQAGFATRSPNRVEYLALLNAGQSAGIESGVARCHGRYIALLDSDDRWLPAKLAEVARVTSDHPEVGMIVHPQFVIDPEGRRTGDIRPKSAKLSHGDLRAQMRLTGRHVAGATSGVTIRADLFRALMPMPTKEFKSAADQYLTFGATFMEPVYALSTPLSEYRVHPDGQYIRRMMTADGVSRQMDLQRTIAAHFGVEDVIDRNPFFARHRFALAKLRESFTEQCAAYGVLVRALWVDGSFSALQKSAFAIFWGIALLAPRSQFLRMWKWFQFKQTGRGRVPSARPA